jgi:hypothetical protein
MGGTLTKFNKNGELEWSKIFYSPYGAIDMHHAVGKDGCVYLSTSRNTAHRLIKYTTDGSEVFNRLVGSYGFGTGLVLDTHDNVLISGYANIDSLFEGTKLASYDFIAKYSSEGYFQWVKTFYNNTLSNDFAITVDSQDNIYSTASFYNSIQLCDSVTLTSPGQYNTDAYVAKFDSTARLIWVSPISSEHGSEWVHGIAVNNLGEVFVGGISENKYPAYEESPSVFGNISVTNDRGYGDIFVAKYDASGACQWVRTAGSPRPERLFDLYADDHGNVFATGRFPNKELEAEEQIVQGDSSYTNLYVLHYNTNGVLVQAIANTSGGADGYAITGDNKGGLYLAGDFAYQLKLGSLVLDGYNEMYVAKMTYHLDNSLAGIPENTESPACLYPNPTKGLFRITVKERPITSVQAMNMLGEIIDVGLNIHGPLIEGNLGDAAPGLYFIRSVCGVEVFVNRVIKD